MNDIQPSEPMNTKDHPSTSVPTATQHFWGDVVNRMMHGPSIFTTPMGSSEQEADLQNQRKARNEPPKYTGRGESQK